jgi:hypothetical protein
MEAIDNYREAIHQALLNMKDADGNAKLTEEQAKQLAEEFSDEELNDGMPFNTPEEVAELLVEWGLD